MCWMLTVLSATDSRMAFSRIVMCRRPLVVVDLDQHTQALLSLKILMGDDVGRNICVVSVSWMMFCRRRMALTHSSVAYISASAELRAVTFCRQDTQWMGPLKRTMKPESDLVLKRGSSSGRVGSGRDWS